MALQRTQPKRELDHGLDTLDLTMITEKLMDAEEGQGWSQKYSDRVAVEYRRFLALTRRYPGSAIVPSKSVSRFNAGHR